LYDTNTRIKDQTAKPISALQHISCYCLSMMY